MGITKRDFLKIAGVSAIGAGAVPASKAIAGFKDQVGPNKEALTGERWAMVVDVRKCPEGCDDCAKACHFTHNVPEFTYNKRHEIKWIWHEKYVNAFAVPENEGEYVDKATASRPFLVLCNHCDNPPCVRVCPTQATFKRKDGVVMMDYHRCIGCRFCMAACPYGSRSFNLKDPRLGLDHTHYNKDFPTRMKGVVEKCNFCAERLAVGKIPVCVEACKHGALAFGDLADENSQVSKLLRENYTVKRKPELGTLPMVYYIVR